MTGPPPPDEPTLQSRLAPFLHRIERLVDRLRYRWNARRRADWSPTIVGLAGLRRPGSARLIARVFQEQPPIAGADTGRLRRLARMWRRMVTREIPFARVDAVVDGAVRNATADEEGVVDVAVQSPDIRADATGENHLHLRAPVESASAEIPPERVSVLRASSRCVVISDLDDTVVQMKVLGLKRMLSTILFADAKTRSTFEGVPELYRWLHDDSGARNPIVYVSSSPWNVHDLVSDFLALNDMPDGAILLRNWGLSDTEIVPTRHAAYKFAAIRGVLRFFDPIPVILIGDDGEEDPEIYAEIAREQPDRVRAIFIRKLPDLNTADESRMDQLSREMRTLGVGMTWTDSANEMLAVARRELMTCGEPVISQRSP